MQQNLKNRGLVLASLAVLSATGTALQAATWSGPASGSWNTGSNWNPVGVPGSSDTASFVTGSGTISGTISLGAAQTINTLSIGASVPTFTIGNAGESLTLTNVTRGSSSSNPHTIAANVVLAGNSTWDITSGGPPNLTVTGVISAAGGNTYTLTKQGSGELRFSAANTYTGDTIIKPNTTASPSTITVGSAGQIKGNLIIGDGTGATASAVFDSTVIANTNAVDNNADVTIKSDGKFKANTSEVIHNLTLYAGGQLTNSVTMTNLTLNEGANMTAVPTVSSSINMTGGTIGGGTGTIQGTMTSLTSHASSSQSVLNAVFQINNVNYTIGVEDGAAAVDVKFTRKLTGGGAGKTLTKSGAGVMLLTNNGTSDTSTLASNISVTGGTLLVNNVANSGTGTGTGALSVSGSGSKLGGTGTIAPGGTNGVTISTGSLIAPGGDETGDTLGTLTLNGGGTTGTLLTMNSGAKFAMALGTAGGTLTSPGTSDRLNVLSAAANDAVFNSTVIDLSTEALTSGGYFKLFDTDLASGTWKNLTLSGQAIIGGLTIGTQPNNATSTQLVLGDGITGDAGDIYLSVTIPEPATVTMAIGLASVCLLARSRRQAMR